METPYTSMTPPLPDQGKPAGKSKKGRRAAAKRGHQQRVLASAKAPTPKEAALDMVRKVHRMTNSGESDKQAVTKIFIVPLTQFVEQGVKLPASAPRPQRHPRVP